MPIMNDISKDRSYIMIENQGKGNIYQGNVKKLIKQY